MAAVGFFRSPTGTAVTWDENGQHTDTGQPYEGFQLPTPQYGFFSTNEADNALANRGTPSAYNQWADQQPETYQAYLAKIAAAHGPNADPLAAWLNAGTTPMTEEQYNARNAQAASDAARGVTFGGGTLAPQTLSGVAAAGSAPVGLPTGGHTPPAGSGIGNAVGSNLPGGYQPQQVNQNPWGADMWKTGAGNASNWAQDLGNLLGMRAANSRPGVHQMPASDSVAWQMAQPPAQAPAQAGIAAAAPSYLQSGNPKP